MKSAKSYFSCIFLIYILPTGGLEVSAQKQTIQAGYPSNHSENFLNYINPFNPGTNIRFTISELRITILKVFDVLGNEITTLVKEEKPPGTYEVEFNTATVNRNLASGIYFYQLKAGEFIQTKKMVLMK